MGKYSLSNEEIIKVVEKIKLGKQEDFEILLNNYSNLIWKIVNECRRTSALYDSNDLFQQGAIGLMRAIETYDSTKAQFSTYVYYWIKQSIGRFIKENSTSLKVPEYVHSDFNLYKQYLVSYKENFGILPSDEEITNDLKFTTERLRAVREYENYVAVSFSQEVGEDSSLEYFIGTNDVSYDLVEDKEAVYSNLRIIKKYLKTAEYFVFYYVEYKGIKVCDLARNLCCSSQLISQYLKRAKNKLLKLFNNEKLFNRLASMVDNTTSVDIGSIDDYVKYFLIRDGLDDFERKVYISIYLEKSSGSYFEDNMLNRALAKIGKLLIVVDEHYLDLKKELLEQKKMLIFDVPKIGMSKNYRDAFKRFENISLEEFIKLDRAFYQGLSTSEKELLKSYFAYSKCYFSDSELRSVERKINLYLLGYNRKTVNLPLRLLKQTYFKYRESFSKENQDLIENYILGDKKKYMSRKQDTALRMQKQLLIRQLEQLYFGIRGRINNFLTRNMVKDVLDKYQGQLNEREKFLLTEYFLKEKDLKEIGPVLGVDFITVSGYMANACDKAIKLYLGRKTYTIRDKDCYRELILNWQIDIDDDLRRILYLKIIADLSNKEISERLGLSIKKVADLVLNGLKKLDLIRYGLDNNNKIFASLEEIKLYFAKDCIENKIVKDRFIHGKRIDEISEEYDVEMEEVSRIIKKAREFIVKQRLKEVDLDIKDLAAELDVDLRDSIFDKDDLIILSKFYGYKSQYNLNGEEMDEGEKKKYRRIVDRMRKNIKMKKLGLLSKIECAISFQEAKKLLSNLRNPLLDEDRNILIDLKLNGLSRNELLEKYQITDGSLSRKIKTGILTLMKYKSGELEDNLIFDVDVLPNLRYFCLPDQEILKLKYEKHFSSIEIATCLGISREQVFERLNRIENELYLIIKKDKYASHFDFEYARNVITCEDLPFNGNLEVARNIYNYVWGEIDGKCHNYIEAIKYWKLDLDNRRVSEYLINLMIAISKYRKGFRKANFWGYSDVKKLYDKLLLKGLRKQEEEYFEHYFKRVEDGGDESEICDWILYEIIKDRKMAIFSFDMSKEEVKPLLKKISMTNKKMLSIVMRYYGFSERNILNGKEINQILRIFDCLATRLDKNKQYKLQFDF